MKLRQTISCLAVGAALAAASASSQAAVLLSEGFDSVSGLGASGWSIQNNSSPVGPTSWFQGNTAVFSAASGASDSYAAANFSSATAPGVISTWLITPVVPLDVASTLAFAWRVAGAGFLDTLEIYVSTSGASTDVGSTSTSTGVFTQVGTVAGSTDLGWTDETISLGAFAAGTTGRLAFRYVAANNFDFSNYLGLDNVSLATDAVTVPEPAPVALLALALAGMAALRRRA